MSTAEDTVSITDADLLDRAPADELGRRIRVARLARSLSQAQVAEPKCSAAYLSRIEDGQRKPSVDVLAHIAQRLGMTFRDVVLGIDESDVGDRLLAYLSRHVAVATTAWLKDSANPDAHRRMTFAASEWERAAAAEATPPADVHPATSALLEDMVAAVLKAAEDSDDRPPSQETWDRVRDDLRHVLPIIDAAMAATRAEARAAIERALEAFDGAGAGSSEVRRP